VSALATESSADPVALRDDITIRPVMQTSISRKVTRASVMRYGFDNTISPERLLTMSACPEEIRTLASGSRPLMSSI
jgi:hypothetical protein